MAARPSDFKRTPAEKDRARRETLASLAAFDSVMQRRAAEHRVACAVFRIPLAPVEIPPCGIEMASRDYLEA